MAEHLTLMAAVMTFSPGTLSLQDLFCMSVDELRYAYIKEETLPHHITVMVGWL